MDALRRAETPVDEAADAAPATTEEAAAVVEENDATDLSLEPLNDGEPQAMEAGQQLSLEEDAGKTPAADTDTSSEPPAETETETVRRTHAVLVPRSSRTQNMIMFGSGLALVLLVVGAYYAWKASELPAQRNFASATLIDSPEMPEVSQKDNVRQESSSGKSTAVAQKPAASAGENKLPGNEATVHPQQETGVIADATRQEPLIRISKQKKVPGTNAELAAAYGAYQKQDFVQAEKLYKRVLRRYPENRDATLGLAAIAMYQGRYSTARDYYARVLKANPADNVARVALHSLIGTGDSFKDGSRLKQWLQSEPDNPQLHFALGNHHAGLGQWKEAQRAYFEAFRLAPTRADYAFNLAVTLDRLMLHKQALEYYLKARELAGKETLFNSSQLERRITQLETDAGSKL